MSDPEAEAWWFRASETTDGDPLAVPALGVADVLTDYSLSRIDVFKVDIEGSEHEVFSHGVDAWIDRVETIAIEVRDALRPGCTEMVRDALVPLDFASPGGPSI